MVTRITFIKWCSVFAFLSAGAHFTVLLYWDRYTSDLALGRNSFRWFEYSLSSSVIITLLFMLWGNFDFVQLSGVFTINAMMNLFGDMHERMNGGKAAKDVDWSAFIYGTICGVVPWFLMFYQITLIPADMWDEIPWFVWAFLLEYILLFFSFPINIAV